MYVVGILLAISLLVLGIVVFLSRQRSRDAGANLSRKSELAEPPPSTPAVTKVVQPPSPEATHHVSAPGTAKTISPLASPKNFWSSGLKKSREPFLERLKEAVQTLSGTTPWNENHPLWERLEETLLAADLGPKLSDQLLRELKKEISTTPTEQEIKDRLCEKMVALLERVSPAAQKEAKPLVTILIGVNGAGKTTTAGKLAFKAQETGHTVILGAADTFRAAAVEQLQTWADRLGVECIKPAQGANPAAVAFDAAAAAVARDAQELIIDTAGRLHTKENLMEELKKLARVLDKKIPGAPHRVYLVLDASLGQNALQQAREFSQAIPATGVILTKLDGSAKGGAVLALSTELGIPVTYVGLGENVEDLREFQPRQFVQHLLQN